jgi:hypothetical protein
MSDSENFKENKQSKSYLNEDKQSINNEKEKPKKIIKIRGEKEKINKKKYENNSFNGEKNEQSKNSFDIYIIKKEKFLVKKYTKLQKTLEKNIGSKINKNRLNKKKVYFKYNLY